MIYREKNHDKLQLFTKQCRFDIDMTSEKWLSILLTLPRNLHKINTTTADYFDIISANVVVKTEYLPKSCMM